jgi:hypothetical protein
MNRGPDIHIVKEAISAKVPLTGDDVKNPEFKVGSLKDKLKGKCQKCKRGGH